MSIEEIPIECDDKIVCIDNRGFTMLQLGEVYSADDVVEDRNGKAFYIAAFERNFPARFFVRKGSKGDTFVRVSIMKCVDELIRTYPKRRKKCLPKASESDASE
jgi:hypothetical protein